MGKRGRSNEEDIGRSSNSFGSGGLRDYANDGSSEESIGCGIHRTYANSD